jgi:xeroderma pigmentosum group C-complementing protein
VHIRHAYAQQAAQILRVDYADAVTGFQFKGRQGTAVIEGAVVPEQFAEAVSTVIDGLKDEKIQEASMDRSATALRLWARFLKGLLIMERVSKYGNSDVDENVLENDAVEDITSAPGGFLSNDFGTHGDIAMPTAGLFSLEEMSISNRKTSARARKRTVDADESESDILREGDSDAVKSVRWSTRSKRRVVANDSEDEYMPDVYSLPLHGGDEEGGELLPVMMEVSYRMRLRPNIWTE